MSLGSYVVTYAGVPSTDLTGFICHEVERGLIGARRTTFENIPGMEGAYVAPEEPGLRRIEIDASILIDAVNPAQRRAAVREVAAWYSHASMQKLIISDEPDLFEMAIAAEAPNVREWRQRGQFVLPFWTEPYSYQVELQHAAATAVGTTVDVIVDVDGTAPTTPFIVEMTASGASSFQYVTVNGRTWTRGTALAGGQSVTFNTKAGVMLLGVNTDTDLQGVYDPDDVSMGGGSGRPPWLEPGLNTIEVGMNHTGFDVDVWWRGRHE
jgi:predicted phage tail component-like protein